MNALISQTTAMLELLPDEDISLVNTFVKKLMLAWDPDFTKVTPDEKKTMDEADEEMSNGIYVSESEVWE